MSFGPNWEKGDLEWPADARDREVAAKLQSRTVLYERVYLCGLRASGSVPPPSECPEHGTYCPNAHSMLKGGRPEGW